MIDLYESVMSLDTPNTLNICNNIFTISNFFRVRVQVPFQWPYTGSGFDSPIPAGCFLYQTFLQGPAQTVSVHTHNNIQHLSFFRFLLFLLLHCHFKGIPHF